MQVRVSIGFHVFLDFNSWICKTMLRSRVMARFAYFEYLFRTVRSETSGATLYLAVSSAL